MVPSGPHGRRTDERARRCHPHPGADEAVWGARSGPRHRPRRASRRELRADRAGRRREDLDVPDPRRRDGGDVRRRQPARAAGGTEASVRRLPHAGVQPLAGPECGGEPPLRRRAAARAGARDRAARESLSQDVRDGALHRAARGAAQRRHEAEAGARLAARGRAPHSPARRADDGRRSGLSPRVLGRARAALEPGHDDSPGDAVSRRGGAVPSRGPHARRAPASDRHAGRAAPVPGARASGGARARPAPGGDRPGAARRDRRCPAVRRPPRRARARGAIRRACGARRAGRRRGERARRITDAREHLRRDPARPRGPHGRAARKRWVLEFAGLEGQGGQVTGSLPGGWKQRVAFGAAIMHEPRVLFLDEPTSGVDPIARRAFWAMINQLADQGAAILVTTHYLEEAEQCNRLGFMVAGELVAEGTPSGVKAAQGGRVLEIYADEPLRAVALLKTAMEPWRVSLFGDRLHVIVDGDAPAAARELTARLAREGIRVLDAREEDYSLEDVFLVIAEKGAVAA